MKYAQKRCKKYDTNKTKMVVSWKNIILQIVLIFICIVNFITYEWKIIILTLRLFFISLYISCIIEVWNYNPNSYENDYINFIIYYNYYIIYYNFIYTNHTHNLARAGFGKWGRICTIWKFLAHRQLKIRGGIVCEPSISWARPDQSRLPQPTFWKYILILSCHLRLVFPSGFFPSDLPTKILYAPLLSPNTLV